MPSGSISAPCSALIPGGNGCAMRSLDDRVLGEATAGPVVAVKGDQRTMIVLARAAVQAVPAGLERFHGDQLAGRQIRRRPAPSATTSPHSSCPRMTGLVMPVNGCGVLLRVVTGPS